MCSCEFEYEFKNNEEQFEGKKLKRGNLLLSILRICALKKY